MTSIFPNIQTSCTSLARLLIQREVSVWRNFAFESETFQGKTMSYKFLTLIAVVIVLCLMELKAFVRYSNACHIHVDMEI